VPFPFVEKLEFLRNRSKPCFISGAQALFLWGFSSTFVTLVWAD
jgi:hypothetical protein